MKTPEEMAEEYLDKNYELNPHFPADVQGDKLPDRQAARPAFLAGYRAAKDQVIKEVEFYRQQEKIIFLLKNYAATIHTNSVRDALKDFIGQLESIVGKTVANHIPQSEKMDQTTNVNGMRFCIYCNDFHGGACAELRGKNHPALNQTNLPTSAKWISVKDRLPSCGVLCAWILDTTQSCIERIEVDDMHPWYEGFDYWCELPEPPKEDK